MNFEETLEQREARLQKAVEFAGKYVRSFDPELLTHLYRTIVEHTLPANASLQERAELDGQRKLIVGIIRQYQLAATGSPETPWQTTSSTQQPRKNRKPRK